MEKVFFKHSLLFVLSLLVLSGCQTNQNATPKPVQTLENTKTPIATNPLTTPETTAIPTNHTETTSDISWYLTISNENLPIDSDTGVYPQQVILFSSQCTPEQNFQDCLDSNRSVSQAFSILDSEPILWNPLRNEIILKTYVGLQPKLILLNSFGEVTKTITAEGFSEYEPALSPDGEFLSFLQGQAGSDKVSLIIYNLESEDITNTLSGIGVNNFGWLNNAEILVQVEQNLFVLNIFTQELRQILTTYRYFRHVTISPDKKWLVFESGLASEGFQQTDNIYLHNMVEQTVTRILQNISDSKVIWMPDSQSFFYAYQDIHFPQQYIIQYDIRTQKHSQIVNNCLFSSSHSLSPSGEYLFLVCPNNANVVNLYHVVQKKMIEIGVNLQGENGNSLINPDSLGWVISNP
jgi:Tol biopolymer transport system component